MLVRTENGLRFAHDLFREVLAAGLTADARAALHLSLARVLEEQAAAGGLAYPAELAAHYCAVTLTRPDPAVRSAAVRHSRAAAAAAAARLAFADAVGHLERVLPLLDTDAATRLDVLLELGEARRKAGLLALARATYLDGAALARAEADDPRLARAALGLHAVGAKTGPSAEREQTIRLLQQAAGTSGLTPDLTALVNAALARDLHHSLDASRTPRARQLAQHAVSLARGSRDRWTLAHCLIAAHDVCWRPGSARERLTVLDELLALARQLHSADLTAQARLLRATALLELGDPAAHAELDLFCRESEQLGDAAARWDAQSRRAAAALLVGQLEEAGALIGAAGRAAQDMGSADAVLIHDIQRWELARFQAGRGSYRRRRPDAEPPVETWPPWRALLAADGGELERATAVMAGFPVEQSDGPGATAGYDLWFPSIAAEAAARCGTSAQRRQLYERLLPLAGTHVVCGATVAYSGAVDHYLGLLAASLGEHSAAADHLTAAVAQHHQLGASAWAQLSALEQGADSVRDVIERRLARFPQATALQMAAASLDTQALRPGLLQQALAVDVETHLELAAAAGVLVRTENGLRFAHDLFREVLAAGLTADARAALHLSLARVLEEQAAAGGLAYPAELAAHYCAVTLTRPDPAVRSAAVRHSRAAAAAAAARLAFADAVGHLERVLPLLDTDAATRLDVLLELGEARRKAGLLALARATYLDGAALARAEADDPGWPGPPSGSTPWEPRPGRRPNGNRPSDCSSRLPKPAA